MNVAIATTRKFNLLGTTDDLGTFELSGVYCETVICHLMR